VETPFQVVWASQTGGSIFERSDSVALGGLGGIYTAGSTGGGPLSGGDGPYDALLTKHDSSGNVLWTRQFGASTDDYAFGVAADVADNVYVSGLSRNHAGVPGGLDDGFLVKYDAAGTALWSSPISTSRTDAANAVAVDASANVYVTGRTSGSLAGPNAGNGDAFLIKYDSAGSVLWSRQMGTPVDDDSRSIAIDGLGNAYISGFTLGDIGAPNAGFYDSFLTKYDSTGNLIWSRQMGTSADDRSRSVAVDALGYAYITGDTRGSLSGPNAGISDVFLTKYDPLGNLVWSLQIGTSGAEVSTSVALDASGDLYVSGYTQGSLGGPSQGGVDTFLLKYDSSGTLLWSRQLGTTAYDQSNSVVVDLLGSVYMTGYTYGSLGGPSAGNSDAFLMKLSPVPEPTSLALFGVGAALLLSRRTASKLLSSNSCRCRTSRGQPSS